MEVANPCPFSSTSIILENDAIVHPAVPIKTPGVAVESCLPYPFPQNPSNQPASPLALCSHMELCPSLSPPPPPYGSRPSLTRSNRLLLPLLVQCGPLATQQHRDITFQPLWPCCCSSKERAGGQACSSSLLSPLPGSLYPQNFLNGISQASAHLLREAFPDHRIRCGPPWALAGHRSLPSQSCVAGISCLFKYLLLSPPCM